MSSHILIAKTFALSQSISRCGPFVVTFLLLMFSSAASADNIADSKVVQSGQKVIVKLFGAGVGTLDSYGSGVVVSENGHVATVWNHLVNTGYLTAVTASGKRFDVKVVGTSAAHDLAVLKLQCEEDDRFPFIDLAKTARPEVQPGESVFAFSNMFHVATGNEPVSIVHGTVACETPLLAGLGRWEFPVKSPVLLLDAITNNSGAAGGLLADSSGQPLGMLGREIRHRGTNMWVNYAVPWRDLQPVIQKLIAGERIESASGSDDDDRRKISERKLTASFGFTLLPSILGRTPAYIDRIIPDSQASKSGLERGDLVIMVNDTVVGSVDDLRHLLTTFRPGQRISLTVNRNDSLESIRLRMPR